MKVQILPVVLGLLLASGVVLTVQNGWRAIAG